MRRFISHSCLFLLIVCVLGAGIILIRDDSDTDLPEDAVYVWGDSQMYQGLDLGQLSELTGRTVFSSACHGAGVYDFMVFVDKIPDSSRVVVSFPECALFRDPKSDSNRSGMDVVALKSLYDSGYSFPEILTIAKQNNYHAKRVFYSSPTHLYEYADTITYSESLEGFVRMYSKTDAYIDTKVDVYLKGVQSLYDKNCAVSFVSFPFAEELDELVPESVCRVKADSVVSCLVERYGLTVVDVPLAEDTLLMHDLSHMNEIGARRFTEILSQDFCDGGDTFYDVQLR